MKREASAREGAQGHVLLPSRVTRTSRHLTLATVRLKNAKKITPVLLKKILGDRATFLHIKRPDKTLNPT